MNIIEAIKSGKKFRRPCFPEGRLYEYEGQSLNMIFKSGDYSMNYHLDKQDILADDWEVSEEKSVEERIDALEVRVKALEIRTTTTITVNPGSTYTPSNSTPLSLYKGISTDSSTPKKCTCMMHLRYGEC